MVFYTPCSNHERGVFNTLWQLQKPLARQMPLSRQNPLKGKSLFPNGKAALQRALPLSHRQMPPSPMLRCDSGAHHCYSLAHSHALMCTLMLSCVQYRPFPGVPCTPCSSDTIKRFLYLSALCRPCASSANSSSRREKCRPKTKNGTDSFKT